MASEQRRSDALTAGLGPPADQAGDNEGNSGEHTPASQSDDQGATQHAGATSSNNTAYIVEVADEVDSHEEDLRESTPASQSIQQAVFPGTDATFSNTVGNSSDPGSIALIDSTPADEDPRLADLISVQRFRLMKLEAEKQVTQKKAQAGLIVRGAKITTRV